MLARNIKLPLFLSLSLLDYLNSFVLFALLFSHGIGFSRFFPPLVLGKKCNVASVIRPQSAPNVENSVASDLILAIPVSSLCILAIQLSSI
jgi:hypothetical protein